MSSIHSGKLGLLKEQKSYEKIVPISKVFSQFKGGIGGKCVMITDSWDRKIMCYPSEEEIDIRKAQFLWIKTSYSLD